MNNFVSSTTDFTLGTGVTASSHVTSTIDRITSLMAEKSTSRKAQTQALESIWKYAVKKKQSDASFASSGVVSLIFSAMRNFPKDAKLQEMACGAMGQISFCNPKDRYAIANNGAVPLITRAMKNHPNNASVQKRACSLLGNLACDNRSARASIHDHDGVVLIHRTMTVHANDVPLREKAFYALSNICKRNNTVVHAIMDNRGLNFIAAALKSGDPRVGKSLRVQALGLLCRATYDNECKLAVAEGELLGLVVNTLTRRKNADGDCGGGGGGGGGDAVEIVRKSLAVLCSLSRKDLTDEEQRLIDDGSGGVVDQRRSEIDSVRTGGSSGNARDADVTPCGEDCAIRRIVYRIVETGVVRALPSVVLIHANDAQVQGSACFLVRNLSYDRVGARSVRESFTPQFLESVAKKSATNRRYVNETLQNLNADAYSVCLSSVNSM